MAKHFKCTVECDHCGKETETTGSRTTTIQGGRHGFGCEPYASTEENVEIPKGWLFFNSATVKMKNKEFSFYSDPEFCSINCLTEWLKGELKKKFKR